MISLWTCGSWCLVSFGVGGLVQLHIGDRKLRALQKRVDALSLGTGASQK